jgi:hypothetical protein
MASTLSRGQALRLAFDPKQIAVIDA